MSWSFWLHYFLLVILFQGGHCLIYCHFSFTLFCLLSKNGFEPVKYYLCQLAKGSALSVESTGVTFQRGRVFLPGLISHLASSCSTAVSSNIHLLGHIQLFQGPALQCGLFLLSLVSCTEHRFFSTKLPPHESSAVSIPMTHSGRQHHQPATSPATLLYRGVSDEVPPCEQYFPEF